MVAVKNKINLRKHAVLLFLILICVITGIAKPVFLSYRNIINVLGQISVIGIMSLGMTAVILSGGIDLSVGSMLSLVAVVTAKLVTGFPELPIFIPILIGLLLGIGLGCLNGVIVSFSKAQPFVVTLGMMSVFQGISQLITGGYTVTNLGEDYEFLGSGRIAGVGVNTIVFLILILCFYYFLNCTKRGRYCYAIGGSESTSFLAGINTNAHKIFVYGLNGFMVGVAAVIFSARIGSALPLMGTGYELQAIAAVVIGGVSLTGGRGNLTGALLGVLLLGVIQNSLNLLRIETYYQNIVFGLIIVLAVTAYREKTK